MHRSWGYDLLHALVGWAGHRQRPGDLYDLVGSAGDRHGYGDKAGASSAGPWRAERKGCAAEGSIRPTAAQHQKGSNDENGSWPHQSKPCKRAL